MSQIMRYNTGSTPPPGTFVETLTGDLGGPVGPDLLGNINVITDNANNTSGATFLVNGTPVNNTLTIIASDADNNTQFGFNAGNTAQSGSRNTSLGAESQSSITSGSDNTSVGYQTLDLITSGINNVAIGSQAAANLSTTSQNTFVGTQAGQNSTSNGNTGIGYQALRSVNGFLGDNTAIGRVALTSLTTGDFNVAIGVAAAQFNTTGGNNVLIGVSSGAPLAGSWNTAVGRQALGYNGILPIPTTSSFNTVLGAAALIGLKTGQYNTVIGGVTSAGLANGSGNALAGAESSNLIIVNDGVVGDNNTIRIGRQGAGVGQQNRNFQAGINGVTVASPAPVVIDTFTNQLGVDNGTGILQTLTGDVGPAVSPTAGNINVASGLLTNNSGGTVFLEGSGSTLTLEMSDTVLANTFIGASAGNTTTTGINNTAVGISAGASLTTAGYNTLIGRRAGVSITTSQNNTFIGEEAGHSLTVAKNVPLGDNNTAVGLFSLGSQVTCESTTAIGAGSIKSGNWGDFNTGLGHDSLGGGMGGGGSPSYNLACGYRAGVNLVTNTCSSNIYLNHQGTDPDSNTLRIGAATGSGNQQLNRAFICGIDGINVGSVAKVITMASDQLGTATITAGTGITVTPGANTITISATTTGMPWTVVTGASQALAVNNGYIANNAGTINFSLPASSAVGDTIRITGINNVTGWQITQGAGQQIFFGSASTTLGAGGSITSSQTRDSIEIVCVVANTTYNVLSSVGNPTIV